MIVEAPVDGRSDDRHVRVGACEYFDAFRRSDYADELDALGARLLDAVDRGRSGTARGQHWVAEEDGLGNEIR